MFHTNYVHIVGTATNSDGPLADGNTEEVRWERRSSWCVNPSTRF